MHGAREETKCVLDRPELFNFVEVQMEDAGLPTADEGH